MKNSEASISKVLVIPLGNYLDLAYGLTSNLRKNNVSADVLNAGEGLKKKLSIASKMGAKFAAIIGEDEVKNEIITLKDMETGEQVRVNIDGVVDFVRSC